jgi:hypothetical protein
MNGNTASEPFYASVNVKVKDFDAPKISDKKIGDTLDNADLENGEGHGTWKLVNGSQLLRTDGSMSVEVVYTPNPKADGLSSQAKTITKQITFNVSPFEGTLNTNDITYTLTGNNDSKKIYDVLRSKGIVELKANGKDVDLNTEKLSFEYNNDTVSVNTFDNAKHGDEYIITATYNALGTVKMKKASANGTTITDNFKVKIVKKKDSDNGSTINSSLPSTGFNNEMVVYSLLATAILCIVYFKNNKIKLGDDVSE